MSNWLPVLECVFDKKIQPPENGKHAYKLLRPVFIYASGFKFQFEKDAIVTFPYDGAITIASNHSTVVAHHIALSSIAVIELN